MIKPEPRENFEYSGSPEHESIALDSRQNIVNAAKARCAQQAERPRSEGLWPPFLQTKTAQ